MARDRNTITAICAIFVHALFAYQRREAKKASYDKVLSAVSLPRLRPAGV